MSEENYGFVITKPLQLMVVLALLEQLPQSGSNEFLIVNCFSDAKEVSVRLAKVLSVNCFVKFFESEALAYSCAQKSRYSKLFIDSDVGFSRNLTLTVAAVFSPHMMISVYEEGLGTYREDFYDGFKKNMLRLFGCGVFFGGNWRVKELYVFSPDEYKNPIRAQKIKIKKEIATLLVEGSSKFEFIFDTAAFFEHALRRASGFNDCFIYLSNWEMDQDVIEWISGMRGLVVIKPHPHLKNIDSNQVMDGSLRVRAGIPAELLIAWAAKIFENVIVFHHGSSVVRYIKYRNVIFSLLENHKD